MYTTDIKSLHVKVSQRVREMISVGTLKKGQKISEQDLAITLGVSRTPIREALFTLAAEGLITLNPNRGAYVSQPQIFEMRQMFEAMSLIEGECARIASVNMTTPELKQIESLHRQLEKNYLKRDHKSYLKINRNFHEFVQKLSGNMILHEIASSLQQKIHLYRSQQLYQADRFDQSLREHRDIIEAFQDRDAPAAEATMKKHLIKQCVALESLYLPKEPEKKQKEGE